MKAILFAVVYCGLLYDVTATCHNDLIRCVDTLFLKTTSWQSICEDRVPDEASRCIGDFVNNCLGNFTQEFRTRFHDDQRSKKLIVAACKRFNELTPYLQCMSETFPTVAKCLKAEDGKLPSMPEKEEAVMAWGCGYFDGVSSCLTRLGTCNPKVSDIIVQMFQSLKPQCTVIPTSAAVTNSMSVLYVIVATLLYQFMI